MKSKKKKSISSFTKLEEIWKIITIKTGIEFVMVDPTFKNNDRVNYLQETTASRRRSIIINYLFIFNSRILRSNSMFNYEQLKIL